MHAAGVEFDDTFFVGKSTKPHTSVMGIVFRSFHDSQRGIECVSAAS
jgi:hypothetical protein